MAIAPDGRFFIAERESGDVRIMHNGQLLATPFVHVDVATGSEEGLLGIALHPQFGGNGYVYIYYTQAAPKTNRIVRYTASGNVGTNPTVILDNIGSSATGINNGGGLIFGQDGKLYAAIGDMGVGSDAQSMSSLAGKILRMEDDGSYASGNPHGGLSYPYNLIYALGYRNTPDLDIHAGAGTLYAGDDYDSDATCDETNVVSSGGSYGWNLAACSAGGQTGPLHNISAQLGVSGLASYTGSVHGSVYPGLDDNLFVSGTTTGEIIRDVLTGASFDGLGSTHAFYDPQEPDCPLNITDIAVGRGGWLWALSGDDVAGTGGLYYIIYNGAYPDPTLYPREASGGHEINMLLEEAGTEIKFTWEDLKQDAWLCTAIECPSTARTEKYTFWEGPLAKPFNGHLALLHTNGVPQDHATLTVTTSHAPLPNLDSKYYLLNAWAANQEGTLGYDSDGTERAGTAAPGDDQCNVIGYDNNTEGLCLNDWPHSYPDQNNKQWTLSDFRGKTLLIGFEQFY
jgi:hypothetical protein